MEGFREKIKKGLGWGPGMGIVAVCAVVVLLLLLLPLLRLALYAAPWYDDYNYGKVVKVCLAQDYSLLSALKGAVECARREWWAWQGTFSSVFFMSLMPSVWGDEYYALGPIFLLLLLTFSICRLVKVLARDVLKAQWPFCVIWQAAASAMALVLVHNSQMGFFWYNAGIHYMGMHSFFLLLLASWIGVLVAERKASLPVRVLCTCVGAVAVSGANYVTTLQGLVVGISLLALAAVLRNRRAFLLLPSLMIYGYGFYKNVAAPGNMKRGVSYQGWGLDPISAIGSSFLEAFRYFGRFTGLITLTVVLLLAPIIWLAVRKLRFRFRYPGLLLLWSFCLYATGFTPSLYTLGHAGLDRTLNAVKLTLQILLLVNEVYWLGWLHGRLAGSGRLAREPKEGERIPFVFYIAVLGMALAVFMTRPNPVGGYSSWDAYDCIHKGEAYNFHQEYLERVETIKQGGSTVTVKPYGFRPWILSPDELSEDPQNEPNRSMAMWYDKEAIICQP